MFQTVLNFFFFLREMLKIEVNVTVLLVFNVGLSVDHFIPV